MYYVVECIPLTLEPESQFYADPVIVLDFQSLYPSIMIAYNYCFSTCLGNISELERAGYVCMYVCMYKVTCYDITLMFDC